MIKIVSVEEMRRIEAAADAAGVSYSAMMDNAGRAVAEVVKQMLGEQSERSEHTQGLRVAVLVGPGNNGGDGLVAARILKQETSAEVGCYLAKARTDEDTNFVAARDAGVFLAVADDDQRRRVLHNLVANADILIDALLGTGARLPITGDLKKLLDEAGSALNRRRPTSAQEASLFWVASPRRGDVPGTRVVAVDCPSGLDCDSGQIDPVAIAADVSVTFAAAKHGHLKFPGADKVGELVIASIGIPDGLAELEGIGPELVTGERVAAMLPERSRDSHKGSYGKAMIVAGSVNYTGAPALAARAAYRAGAGLVRLAVPQPIYPMVAAQIPEAIWSLLPSEMGAINASAVGVVAEDLAGFDCLLVGPGIGQDDATADFMRQLLTSPERRSRKGRIGFGSPQSGEDEGAATSLSVPVVIDADGLNLLAKMDDWPSLLPERTILTPHVGEMARLTGLDIEQIQSDRIGVARERALSWKCVVVLKGAFTVIAGPDGQTAVLPFATDALAKAGSGDVLAGCILGMLAQGAAPFEAAISSAYIHGLAGVLVARQAASRSALASDIIGTLPQAIQQVELLRDRPS